MRSTHHGQNLVVREARLAAQLEPPELLDPPDDADMSALPVLHVLLRARPLARGDQILILRCRRQPVVAGREIEIEPPHHAMLIMDALGEIGMRGS